MKYLTHIILSLFAFISITGCHSKNNKKENIHTEDKIANTRQDSINNIENSIFPFYIDKNKNYENKGYINLQEIADIEYVKLETTDLCLLKDKFFLKGVYFDDDNIFISNKENILRFNKNGKFINSIGKKGNGPDEINHLMDFKINKKTKEIFIVDVTSQNIKTFNYDGNINKSIHYKTYFDKISLPNDSVILCGNNYPNSQPMIFYISNTGEIKEELATARQKKTGLKGYITTYYTRDRIYNNQTLFNTNITDTIFSVNNSTLELKPRYIQLPTNTGCGESNSSFFLIFETNRYANILSLKDGEGIKSTYIIDKNKNEINKGLFIDSDSRIVLFPMNTNEDNKLVELYDSFDLQNRLSNGELSGKIKEIAETLIDEDNPVLMIATVRF